MSSSRAYQRVPRGETTTTTEPTTAGGRLARSEVTARVIDKIQAACWVVAAVLTAHYGRVFTLMWQPETSNPIFIAIGFGALLVAVLLLLYATVWLRCITRTDIPFERYAPHLVPIATIAGLCTFFSFIVGLWPAFGLLTPLVVGLMGMGFLFIWHFIPSF